MGQATPICIVESYFDVQLDRGSLRRFDEVKDDAWVDFAKHYRQATVVTYPADLAVERRAHAEGTPVAPGVRTREPGTTLQVTGAAS